MPLKSLAVSFNVYAAIQPAPAGKLSVLLFPLVSPYKDVIWDCVRAVLNILTWSICPSKYLIGPPGFCTPIDEFVVQISTEAAEVPVILISGVEFPSK